jgi:HSP20 family protein
MTLVPWSARASLRPWAALWDLDRELDGLVKRPSGRAPTSASWTPAVDLRETDDGYVLEADLPGLSREDISLSVADDALTLSGEREDERGEEGDHYRRFERRLGRFERSFQFPVGIAGDKVTASYDAGVLRVTVPKHESAKPRQIEVKVN